MTAIITGRAPAGRTAASRTEQLLEHLEEYQEDLEREVADLADLIRHLKEDAGKEALSA